MIEQVLTKEQNGWSWIDVTTPTREELEEVANRYGLHPTSLEDCLDSRHQPKFEIIDEMQFIILRTLEDPEAKTDSVSLLTTKVALFIKEDTIITMHRKNVAIIEDLKGKSRHRSTQRSEKEGQLVFLYQFLKDVIESYRPVVDDLEAEIDELEKEMLLQKQTPALIKDIHWFRSRVSVVRRLFRQSYDVVLKIEDANPATPLLHDVRERLERFLLLTESLRETSNDILNTHLSLAAHRTNEVIRVLTLFSVFFLPLTFIVGVYGMNFVNLPELKWHYGYLGTWGVMGLITLGIYLWFRKKGWL